MARFLVDTNIFLELELGHSRSAECKDFLSNVARGKVKAATTDFIIDSIALVMEDRGNAVDDIRKFLASLVVYKGLFIYNLGLKGRMLAIDEMENEGLDFDDATSVATMRRLGIKVIVSFDRDFDKVHKLTRIEPKKALVRV
jgi:predicted nucleic acid-binding protein